MDYVAADPSGGHIRRPRRRLPLRRPEPPAAPAAPKAKPFSVACVCGAQLKIAADRAEERIGCPVCRRRFELVVEAPGCAFPIYLDDNATSGSTVSADLSATPPPSPAVSAPTAPGTTPMDAPDVSSIICACGQLLRVPRKSYGKVIRCLSCETRIQVATKINAEKGHVDVVPVVLTPGHEQRPQGDSGQFMKVACPCGGWIVLARQDGAVEACPACGTRVQLHVPKNGEPTPVFLA